MFIVLIRTIILYTVVVACMRIMGKRQIGEFQPYELVITIMISELASLPMQDTRIPLIHGIIPIVSLLIIQVVISIIELKFEKSRSIICGKPSFLVKEGKIDIQELKNQRFNINELLEELRLQGYYNLEDIQYAILETNGQLSVIQKTDQTPVTKQDMNIKCKQDALPIALVMDGKINYDNLNFINRDIKWLNQKLKDNHIDSAEKLFIAILDSKNKFYYQYKEDKK